VTDVRAWEITGGFGLDHLALVTRGSAALGAGDVRVAVKAVSINYRDQLMIAGSYDPKLSLPIAPCSDASGEIVEIGPEVTRFAVGDRVITSFAQRWIAGAPAIESIRSTLGGPLPGTLASELVLHETGLVRAPASLSHEEAATLCCAGLTAWHALVDHGRLTAGDTILVQGTGGVSIFALQIARALGARVIATSSSAAKRERLASMGAVASIDYVADRQWGKTVKQLTGGRGVDQVVEVGGAGTLAQSIRAVAVGGIVHVIGILTGSAEPLSITPILMNEVRLQGIMVGPRASLEALVRAVDSAGIRPVVDCVFPFAEAPVAFAHLRSGAHFGKIVIAL
jgi:NADPH:quinone reductase-like Zn-dependent oxidoreductase